MKTRIVSSVALAAVIALGASGCSLIAEQGTAEPYAPSDGIDVNAGSVEVRNFMFIVAEDIGTLNTVFTAVNPTKEAQELSMTVVTSDNAQSVLNFVIEPGTTVFGDPASDTRLALVMDDAARAGTLATVYLQSGSASEVLREIPVLDGTLAEYQGFVISAEQVEALTATAEDAELEDAAESPETPAAE